ncbi:MAG: hypothetical protein JXB32_09245 [Deltaproteobacteria bacterium]|nr:hypothetical protein [Deltaproteobacteria bacterium]
MDVSVPCPKCRHPTRIKARDVRPGLPVECDACGASFALTEEDLERLQKGLDDLTQTTRKFGGRSA